MTCLACDLIEGRAELPGGVIARSTGWVIEHCVGPLGVGTLVVKSERHVVHVADLTEDEAIALGPTLRVATRVIGELTDSSQIYVGLWSYAASRPGHIHYVVQPVSQELMMKYDAHGPELQARMFRRNEIPDRGEVEAFAERAREHWPKVQGSR